MLNSRSGVERRASGVTREARRAQRRGSEGKSAIGVTKINDFGILGLMKRICSNEADLLQ
eukprot:11732551-Karenia_brevis.AAC.1